MPNIPYCYGFFEEDNEYCECFCPYADECEYTAFEEELDSYYNDNFMR